MTIAENILWVNKHYHELQEKYAGRYIAVVDNSVIAIGDTVEETVKKSKRIIGEKKNFHVEFIERGDLHAFNIGISS